MPPWQPIPERADLARTAREALWAIAFARPKSVVLVLSLEVRRHGAQINAAASAVASTTTGPPTTQPSSLSPPIASVVSDHPVVPSAGDPSSKSLAARSDSSPPSGSSSTPANPRMMVVMASPAVAAPLFAPSTSPGSSAQNANLKPTCEDFGDGLSVTFCYV